MKITMTPIVIGAFATVSQKLAKSAGRIKNCRATRNHQNYSILKIGQNT